MSKFFYTSRIIKITYRQVNSKKYMDSLVFAKVVYSIVNIESLY